MTDAAIEDEIVCWPVPEELLASPAVQYRNMFAIELAKLPYVHLVESYVYMDPPAMTTLLDRALRALGATLHGVGVELGSGCGLLGAVAAKMPGVSKVYSVEICEEMVRRAIPKVARGVLGDDYRKLVPVFGSFDDVQLPDNSVDFILEIDSFHHSDNLSVTLKECFRVLRPGGYLLCFDRCHPDTVSDLEVEQMLSIIYSRKFLITNCYPPDVTLTRRQNGEHEYRYFEWQKAFREAGLNLLGAKSVAAMIRPAVAIKGLLRPLPLSLRRRLYKTENASLATTVKWFKQLLKGPDSTGQFGRPIRGPRDTTVFLLAKPAASGAGASSASAG